MSRRDTKSKGGFADLFGDDDTTRIQSKQRKPAKPKPGRRRAAGADAPPPPIDDEALDDESFRGDVPPKEFTGLRMGHIEPETRIDLHGLDQSQAQATLRKAFGVASAAGRRCVLVIHGKGQGSALGHETLKRALPRWLRTPPLSVWVRAFTPALPRDGGEGATYVLLRKSDKGGRR